MPPTPWVFSFRRAAARLGILRAMKRFVASLVSLSLVLVALPPAAWSQVAAAARALPPSAFAGAAAGAVRLGPSAAIPALGSASLGAPSLTGAPAAAAAPLFPFGLRPLELVGLPSAKLTPVAAAVKGIFSPVTAPVGPLPAKPAAAADAAPAPVETPAAPGEAPALDKADKSAPS